MKPSRLLPLFLLALALLPIDAQGQNQAQNHAQDWPARPLRVIVPFPPGTITDIVPRTVFEQLSTQLGQSIIVENRRIVCTRIKVAAKHHVPRGLNPVDTAQILILRRIIRYGIEDLTARIGAPGNVLQNIQSLGTETRG